MDILSMITGQLNDPKVLNQLGKNAGAKAGQAGQLAQTALPLLLNALQKNAQSPEGAKSLDKALDEHKDDPVSNVLGFLKNVDTTDGAKILQHIFSNNNDKVQSDLANKVGLKKNQVAGVLTQLAPLVLGALGNQKKQQGSQSDLGSLLGSFISRIFK